MGEAVGEGEGEGVGEGMGWAALQHLEPLVARLGLHAALVVARVVEVKPQLEALLGPHDACAHEVRQVAVRGEAHAHLVVAGVGRARARGGGVAFGSGLG